MVVRWLLAFIVMGASLFGYHWELSVCAIFHNESPWFREWIEFHRLMGVEHFLLYNHQSTDDWISALQPYIDEGVVEVVDWCNQPTSIKGTQRKAYNDGLRRLRGQSHWVAFIDLDEYLYPVVERNLPQVLADYEEHGGVAVNWLFFGTSGFDHLEEGKLLCEQCTRTARLDGYGSRTIKSVVQPDKTVCACCPHVFRYTSSYCAVDTDGYKVEGPSNPRRPRDRLAINHYIVRTVDWALNHRLPRRLRIPGNTYEGELRYIFDIERWSNQREDRTIHRFLPALRRRMVSGHEVRVAQERSAGSSNLASYEERIAMELFAMSTTKKAVGLRKLYGVDGPRDRLRHMRVEQR